jgi:MFS family permease
MTSHETTMSATPGPASGRSPAAWHTLCACFLSYMLNAMDVVMFEPAMLDMLKTGADELAKIGASELAKTSASELRKVGAFALTPVGAVAVTTAAFLSSAAGGWLAGWLSDRFSRVRTLEGMIALFAVSTFMCGFATDYVWLFFWRALVGVGWGGQWAAAAVLVGEAFGKNDRGRAVGVMQSAWAFGWGIAFFGMPPLAHYIAQLLHLPPDAGWRMMFWMGLSPILLIPYVHWRVEESALIVETRTRLAAEGKKAGTLEIFAPEMLWTTFWASVLSIGALCGYWAIILWLPPFLGALQIDYYYPLLIIGAAAGYLSSAWLSDLDRLGTRGNLVVFAIVLTGLAVLALLDPLPTDKTSPKWLAIVVTGSVAVYLLSALLGEGDLFGRRRNFVLFALFAIVTVFASLHFVDKHIEIFGRDIILWLAFPLGFFSSGAFSGIGAFFTELFPTRIRGMGVGFTYNFGRGFAVLVLLLIPVHAGSASLGSSIALAVLISYGLMVVATLLLPETRGAVLHADGRAPDIATPQNAAPPPGSR